MFTGCDELFKFQVVLYVFIIFRAFSGSIFVEEFLLIVPLRKIQASFVAMGSLKSSLIVLRVRETCDLHVVAELRVSHATKKRRNIHKRDIQYKVQVLVSQTCPT